nr:immunoglobulin heavy chain junction region [Macaca mulatta]MOY17915.1 immunoglobulin heavy chain junction region [Macaca mulatta]MOY17922.1 immunoglobulin heavy chain junction region [Macaca mulatta]MOY17923.1 immunoglobulin heavy chain junction region [Macaca mulatta]MOY17928.1 immunoglobulin heavy chain junction region [Macaca mulatta]
CVRDGYGRGLDYW